MRWCGTACAISGSTTELTRAEELPSVLDAYESFDRRESGWTKVVLDAGDR